MYRDALDEELAFLITYSGARAVFAEDEEQVDKLLALGDRIGTVKLIVYSDPRGMRKHTDPRLISVTELMHHGDAVASEYPALYDELVAATKGEDVAVLCTTSGTTANPKLAMLLPAGSSAIAPAISASIPRDRATNTSPCCRCPGSWSRSMCWARRC